MFAKLFLLFAILPIIEIALLINVGEVIGGWNTVAIVIITAFVGAHLVRKEGVQTLANAQLKMRSGEMPGQEMAEGLLLLIAGVLLVTPGFVTDGIGFLFSMPLTRPLIARYLMQNFGHRVVMHHSSAHHSTGAGFQQSPFQSQQQQTQQPFRDSHKPHDSSVIEGEYQRKDD
ncbi:FxsA family protein [Planctobacterium marinum]|uniref:Membrane protein n=1 Tax=Planctobacterium marinum TaxID=1631968 RepID=A0AA48HT97_9ALTE|nr:membrane protein [Planctobacterium marinum]